MAKRELEKLFAVNRRLQSTEGLVYAKCTLCVPFPAVAAEKGAPDNVRENTYRGKHNATQTVYHFPMQVIICKPFFIGTPKHF